MTFLAEPPPLDPLDLFGRHSPIEPVFMQELLEDLLPTLPTYAAADEQRQADIRLATMHALAAHPDAVPHDGFRYAAQANALQRNAQNLLRLLQRTQTARRKAAGQPTERAGYWFFGAAAHIEPSRQDPAAPPPEQADHLSHATPPTRDDLHRRDPSQRDPEATTHDPRSGELRASTTPRHLRQRYQSQAGETAPAPTPQHHHPACPTGWSLDDAPEAGDALARFTSRRLDPDQPIEDAWAQAEADARSNAPAEHHSSPAPSTTRPALRRA